MDNHLYIGDRLGSLTTQSERHSQRLDTLEADMSRIKAWMALARRGAVLIMLGLSGISSLIGNDHLRDLIVAVLKAAIEK